MTVRDSIFRPLTVGHFSKTDGQVDKVLDLPARSPASRSLAEGRRFGEGRAEPFKWLAPQVQSPFKAFFP